MELLEVFLCKQGALSCRLLLHLGHRLVTGLVAPVLAHNLLGDQLSHCASHTGHKLQVDSEVDLTLSLQELSKYQLGHLSLG